MLSLFSIEISQIVKIFEPEVSEKSCKSLNNVEKSQKFSINLDDLDKYLDKDKSRRRKKKVDLDVMDNLDTSKKLVSTRRTFSISISIGLDCGDHQA
jgi:hypothetical protein